MIAHTIETAKKSRFIKDVFISTDSPGIAAVAEQYGAIVPFLRPENLAADDVPVQSAWKHAVNWNQHQSDFPVMDVMVSLPVTVPMRTADEISSAIELYLNSDCDSVIAVSPSVRHPAYDMVFLDNDEAKLIIPNDDPFARVRKNRAYEITNLIYISSADYAANTANYLSGKVKSIIVPNSHSFDIRSKVDLKLAEILLKEKSTN